MKKLLTLSSFALIILFASCESAADKEDAEFKKIQREEKVDSMVKDDMRRVFFDTIGVANAPIRILSDSIMNENYSKVISINV